MPGTRLVDRNALRKSTGAECSLLIQLSAQNATHASTDRSSKKKSSGDDAGLIAGVAIACVAALMLAALVLYRCRHSSSPAKSRSSSRREAPPSPPVPNPVIDKAPSRRAEPDEQLQFQGGELR